MGLRTKCSRNRMNCLNKQDSWNENKKTFSINNGGSQYERKYIRRSDYRRRRHRQQHRQSAFEIWVPHRASGKRRGCLLRHIEGKQCYRPCGLWRKDRFFKSKAQCKRQRYDGRFIQRTRFWFQAEFLPGTLLRRGGPPGAAGTLWERRGKRCAGYFHSDRRWGPQDGAERQRGGCGSALCTNRRHRMSIWSDDRAGRECLW